VFVAFICFIWYSCSVYSSNHAAEVLFQIQDLHKKYEVNTGRSAIHDLITMKIIQHEAASEYDPSVYEIWDKEYNEEKQY